MTNTNDVNVTHEDAEKIEKFSKDLNNLFEKEIIKDALLGKPVDLSDEEFLLLTQFGFITMSFCKAYGIAPFDINKVFALADEAITSEENELEDTDGE